MLGQTKNFYYDRNPLFPALHALQQVAMVGDVHTFAANSIDCDLSPENPYEINMGDNNDLKKAWKKDIPMVKKAIDSDIANYGRKFIPGNHELNTRDKDTIVKIFGQWAASHGDFISWGAKKSIEYRAKEAGTGLFGRGVSKLIELAESSALDRHLAKDDMERAVEMAKTVDSKIINIAHTHPKKSIWYHYYDYTVIRNPRGRSLWDYAEVCKIHNKKSGVIIK